MNSTIELLIQRCERKIKKGYRRISITMGDFVPAKQSHILSAIDYFGAYYPAWSLLISHKNTRNGFYDITVLCERRRQ